jgi:hypothetical protein
MGGSDKDLPKTVDEKELTIREVDWGELHVNITTFHETLDLSPLLKGLPGDMCQCPHWGMILKGRKLVKYADREEVLVAGDAYYMEPGHTTVTDAGTEWVEFSPSDKLKATNEAIARNLASIARR